MDRDQVRRLEDEIEAAIAEALRRLTKVDRTIPRPSSERIYHLMAKAAVTVFEAVLKERRPAGRARRGNGYEGFAAFDVPSGRSPILAAGSGVPGGGIPGR